MANMISAKELIEIEMKRRRINQREMAKLLGVSAPYVSDILHEKKSGAIRLFEFAEKLGVDISIPNVEKSDIRTTKTVPVISWVHAGMFEECVDMWPVGISGEGEMVPVLVNVSDYAFALRVVGDSMEPRYIEGDIIIVDPMAPVNSGDKCVVKINEDVSFKIMKERDDVFLISSLNTKYPEQIIRKDSDVDFKVIGKVVGMWRY